MNWLEYWIDKIQNASTSDTVPTSEFFIKMNGHANNRQMSKIRMIIEDYDSYIKSVQANNSIDNELSTDMIINKSKSVLEELQKVKIGNIVTINRLIETSLGIRN